MEDEEKIELGSDRDKIQSILNTAPKKRKYYFEQIENAQISEGYTDISIINHIAEVAPDDPDANWLARKRGGIWSFKFEERFQTPPLKIETPPQNMNIIEMLEWLSETDMGESQGQIVISLRLDDLASVIRDLLRFSFFFEYIEEDYKLGGPIIEIISIRNQQKDEVG